MRPDQREYEEDFYRTLPKADLRTFHREWFVAGLLAIAFIGLIVGFVRLSVMKFNFYQEQAQGNRIARIPLSPPRGEILDRNGRPFAVNHLVYDCYFITSIDVDEDVVSIEQLGTFLGLSTEQIDVIREDRIEARISRSMESELWAAEWGELGAKGILVKRDLNQVEVTALLERSGEFPRAFLIQAYRRSYPEGESAAQVVGYMLEISESELQDQAPLGYRMGDMVGKAGIERQYDNMLRGRPGERYIEIDARGRILGESDRLPVMVRNNSAVVVKGDEVFELEEGEIIEPESGVRLSLKDGVCRAVTVNFRGEEDSELFNYSGSGGTYGEWAVFQRPGEIVQIDGIPVYKPSVEYPTSGADLHTTLDIGMQREISELLGDRTGGIVAMDPNNGSILAMVSDPSFDPNLFSRAGADRSGWEAANNDPNFPFLNRPVHNAYVPGSTFKLVTFLAAGDAGLLYSGRTWDCDGRLEIGNRWFHCWNRYGHGEVGITRAVAESCDVAFYLMGDALGHDAIEYMALQIGFGAPTGVDLPSERGGLIPDEEWKQDHWDENWYTGDTYNMVIGQGFLQVNLLQIARMTAVVANGGYLVPQHVNRLLTPSTEDLAPYDRLDVSENILNSLAQGMRRCVTRGTGTACNLDWIEIAGKTGTADDPPRPDPHSWFISYGPYENPKLVLIVFLENGGHGDENAAPLAAEIWSCDSVRSYLEEADRGW